MSYFMVDIEADGPAPGLYSMIAIGVVKVERPLNTTFFGKLQPISDQYDQEALNVTDYTREETKNHSHPNAVMNRLNKWVKRNNTDYRPQFWADNAGFDWSFVNYYFHRFVGENPFGFSSDDLGSFYKGAVKSVYENFKHLRETKHTHDPVDDAMGNAEALLTVAEQHDVDIGFN